jgi:hypothetical protein
MTNEEAQQPQEQSQFIAPEKCSLCSTAYADGEQWVVGFIGVMPLALCEICYNGMVDMVMTLQKEHFASAEDE